MSAVGDGEPSMIRVLLADDQALVRAGFRSLLDAVDDIEVVGEATARSPPPSPRSSGRTSR
jgi:DNA-binding NarL/FixJ family response regulator